MQKSTLFISIILLISMMCRAQVSEYYFKQQSLSYTEITGGTLLWSGSFDNDISSAITIPSFTFNGTAYTSLYVSANGFITFGLAPVATDYLPISTTNAYLGVVSAFGCNLTQAGSGTPAIRYQQVSNEFVIQWKDMMRSGSTGERISFQVRLNTNTNYVYVVYGGTITPGSGTTYPQVGLRGADNTYPVSINNRAILGAGGNWINSTKGSSNADTMYFNSGTPGTVPTAGLTYAWKPLYDPLNFTSTPINQNEIDLTWTKNSLGQNVMVVYSTSSAFGTPVSGATYLAGNSITGGGTVLFYGNGTSFNHTGLSAFTKYYYKIWSYDAVPDYSNGVAINCYTASAIPYLQVFSSGALSGWTTNMNSTDNHGTCGSYGLTEQLTSGTAYAVTPLIGSITSTTYLNFHYRMVDNFGATTPGANDKIEIQVSTDNGSSYTTISTINQGNHVVSTEFANKLISLAAYNGNYIKIKFLCTWGAGNYYVDFDNVLIKVGTDMSYSGSTTEQASITNVIQGNSVCNIAHLLVVTQGNTNPLSVDSITFNTTGCTNAVTDVEAARVFYTTTPVFSTGTQFGLKVGPSDTFSINVGGGHQDLAPGSNYFWLAYAISPTATLGNLVDAQCTKLFTSESVTEKVPTNTNPTGTRKIGSEISGTKTIPGDYSTIGTAVTALNNGVVGSGGVTFNVAAGYTETITTPIILTASGTAANPIIFQKSGSGNNPIVTRTDAGSVATSIIGNHGDGVIILEGADYVTFDRIDVTATNQGVEYGYYLRHPSATDGCKNITIKNANITMTKGTSKCVVGLYSSKNSSSGTIVVTTYGGRHENITVTGNVISNTFAGIYLKGSGFFSDYNYTIGSAGHGNTIQNFGGSAGTSYGVYMDVISDASISYNTIHNMDGGGSAFANEASGIYIGTSVSSDLQIEYNDINLTSVSKGLTGVWNNTTSCNIGINHNTISISNQSAATDTYAFIYNDQETTTASNNTDINSNTFTTSTFNTTGWTHLIYNSNLQRSPAVSNILGNTTSGAISRTGASGTFSLYYNNGYSGTENINDNTFLNITFTGSTNFYGIYSSHSSFSDIGNQNVSRNTISKITGGSGTVYGINLNTANDRTVCGNTIDSVSSAGIINVIWLGNGNDQERIYDNEIFDITSANSSNSTGMINGILVYSGKAVNIYNNFISDLKTPNSTSSDAIRGISLMSSSANSLIGVYYNTIYLNASGGSTFGTSGIFHNANSTATTAALDLRNNIIVNNSTPNGGYSTVAFRRSITNIDNYLTTSNNNVFYAGTPGSKNLILTQPDCQTIETFKTLVGPNRDSLSYSELPPFVNITTPPYNLRLRDDSVSYCESGARAITTPITITIDFDGASRGTKPDIGADEFKGISPFAPAIPEDSVVTNITVPEKVSWCFNAYQTITVAGGGTTVVIAKDGSAEFIAGESISFLPGFHAESGSIVLAHITTDNTFCDGASGSPIVEQPEEKSLKMAETIEMQKADNEIVVKAYPNPNNGEFTITILGAKEKLSEVMICNLQGKKVYSGSLSNNSTATISIGNVNKGIYIMKVTTAKKCFSKKIIIE